jgi:glycosyltransferase involved in cell wall biosynthesis
MVDVTAIGELLVDFACIDLNEVRYPVMSGHPGGAPANFLATLSGDALRVATCHNWLGKSVKMKVYRQLDKLLLRHFKKVVLVSEALRTEVLASGISVDRAAVILNGIAADTIMPDRDRVRRLREDLALPASAPVVCAVGRLVPEKGYAYLLEAAREVHAMQPSVRFIVAGDGPLRYQLEQEIVRKKLTGVVTLAGTRRDIAELLSVSSVFVMPSITEGMPVALLEAMYAGVPVIASSVGSIPRMITSGTSGKLIPPADVKALAAAITDILCDTVQAKKLASAARTSAEQFSSAAMAAKYIAIYEELLSQRAG